MTAEPFKASLESLQ